MPQCTRRICREINIATTGSEPLIIERIFDAPVETIWKAITDPHEMRRWYFEMENFKPEVGCTWRYRGHEGNSLVTMELFREGGKTKLKLTHGLGNLSEDATGCTGEFRAGLDFDVHRCLFFDEIPI